MIRGKRRRLLNENSGQLEPEVASLNFTHHIDELGLTAYVHGAELVDRKVIDGSAPHGIEQRLTGAARSQLGHGGAWAHHDAGLVIVAH